jgi:hypothetical protein
MLSRIEATSESRSHAVLDGKGNVVDRDGHPRDWTDGGADDDTDRDEADSGADSGDYADVNPSDAVSEEDGTALGHSIPTYDDGADE